VTLQNWVLPTGEIVDDPARGLLMGNRGILHGTDQTLGRSRWKHKNWVCCRLEFKGRKRQIMAPGRYTELFFLDEAVAIAAGHRPCGECRRTAYSSWRAAWQEATGSAGDSKSIDAELHAHRVNRDRTQIRHAAQLAALPDGAFVLIDDGPHLVAGDALLPFRNDRYAARRGRRTGTVTVLTPRVSVEVLRHGYSPILHHTAHR
jgi:hypothetical protein